MSASVSKGPSTPGEIAEFQGLYGSFHVSEVLLQKIWLRQQFATLQARTTDGDPIVIRSPGRWNRLAGPDFQAARLIIGEKPVTGAIEVHFRAQAWTQHHHDRDPAYDEVVLHVVLFPPEAGQAPAKTSKGRRIPTLVLIDLLWCDLEEYAEEEAVATLAGRDAMPVLEELLGLEEQARIAVLAESMERRWREKVRFARLRVDRLGWSDACHQTALEILGYRQNRVAMLRLASRWSHQMWKTAPPSMDEALASAQEEWATRGVRPANHPRRRVGQYASWMRSVPDWPDRLRAFPLAEDGVAGSQSSRTVTSLRRVLHCKEFRARIASDLLAGAVSGTRLDTLVVDLVLPFMAAAGRDEAAFPQWQVWYPGDMPEWLREAARHLSPGEGRAPLHNGLLQAVFGRLLEGLRRESGRG
ncbi:MAG TPA: DUF2851 family protein [Opitutaceae bacterium]